MENTLALYVFRITYRGASVTLTVREGFVVDEFITLSRKSDRTAEDESRLTELKQGDGGSSDVGARPRACTTSTPARSPPD